MAEFDDPVVAQADLDLQISRRAFPVTQQLFAGKALRIAAARARVGWHGTDLHPETGAVCLLPENGSLDADELVGEILIVRQRLVVSPLSVYLYCIGTAPMIDDLSLSRRAFFALGLLAREQMECSIEVRA